MRQQTEVDFSAAVAAMPPSCHTAGPNSAVRCGHTCRKPDIRPHQEASMKARTTFLAAAAAIGLAVAVPGTAEAGGPRHERYSDGYGHGYGYGNGHGGWRGPHHWRPHHPHWRPHWQRHHGYYAPPPVYYRPHPYAYAPAPSVYFGFRVP
jgi:hypothetical protein